MTRKVFDIDPTSRKTIKVTQESEPEAVSVPVHEASESVKKERAPRRKSNMLRIAEEIAEEQSVREDDKTALLEAFYAEKKHEMPKKEKPAASEKEKEERRDAPRAQGKEKKSRAHKAISLRMGKPAWIAVGIVAFMGIVWYMGLAAARVHIVLKTQQDAQAQDFAVSFAANAAASSTSVLPVSVFRKDFSYTKTYQATGTTTQAMYIQGTITVYNAAQQTPQILVQGTRFVSSDNKVFRLTQRISVPGYTYQGGASVPGTIVATVQADQPGSAYAVAPGRFSLPGLQGTAKYEKIYGLSSAQFSYDPAGAHSVTVQDVTQAKQDVAGYAFDQAKSDVLKTLPDSVKLFDQALQIQVNQIKTSSKAGDQATQFTATVSGTLALMTFDERDVARFVAQRMPQYQIQSDVVSPRYQFTYDNPQVDFAKGTMTLTVHARREVRVLLDNLSLRQRVSGKTIPELRTDLLSIPGLDQVQLSVWPFWVMRVPSDIDKITVEVQ